MRAEGVVRYGAGALLSGALAIAAACGSDSQPVASDDGAGARLYAEQCASCHGDDLRGTDEGPSHLSRVYEPDHHGDDAFRSAIRKGAPQHHWPFGDMPAIPELDDDEIDEIIAFVRAVQEREGFED